MGVHSHQALYTATGLTFAAVAACVMLGAEPTIYLAVSVYSLIIHAWLIAFWLVRPDHKLLAIARFKIREARLNAALDEEAEMNAPTNITSLNRMFR